MVLKKCKNSSKMIILKKLNTNKNIRAEYVKWMNDKSLHYFSVQNFNKNCKKKKLKKLKARMNVLNYASIKVAKKIVSNVRPH